MHENRLHVRNDPAANFARKRPPRLDLGEEPPRRSDEQHILHDREHDRREHIVVVVARDEQNEEHGDILGDGDSRADIRHNIATVVCAENDAAVREKEVARRRVDEVYHIQHMQVYVGRNGSVDKPVEERQQREASEENRGADPPVHGPEELQVRAQQFAVVFGDRLVHGASHSRAETELCKHQHAEYRREKTVQSQILWPEEPQEKRAVEKREQQLDAARNGVRRHIALDIFLEIEFHAVICSLPAPSSSALATPDLSNPLLTL